jgi:hypothetical protein
VKHGLSFGDLEGMHVATMEYYLLSQPDTIRHARSHSDVVFVLAATLIAAVSKTSSVVQELDAVVVGMFYPGRVCGRREPRTESHKPKA